MDDDRSQTLRAFFANLVAGHRGERIKQAFAAVPREPFAGPGPWLVMGSAFSYVTTPDDDPVFIYHDTLVALDADRGINIGMPSAHALWLSAIDLKPGETVLQVGGGSGYYSAILAELVGPDGKVHVYEIDAGLAARATDNLQDRAQVEVHAESGIADKLPKVDAIYVCAGITQPSWSWLDALRPGGRLLFPLQPQDTLGGMLMITRPASGLRWPAKFVSRAQFIACEGHQDTDASQRLKAAFAGALSAVRSFRIDDEMDETCWFAGDGWWLSTAEGEA
ncbi:MAG: rRNA adenine N-6-methyltransferase family protein [Tardiphaga sp.]